MRSLPVFAILLALLTSAAFGQGWVGQEQVSGSDASSGQPTIAFDASDRPWAVWHGYWEEGSLQFSRWLGDHWDEWHRVGPNLPGVLARFRPCLAFDGQGQAWLVWDNVYSNNTDDIGSSCWAETCWTPEIQVNLPDSTDLDFAPKIACGGGQVWCVWYGGPTDVSPYSVYASRWNDDIGRWDGETQVSPADGNHHWWCDVAVDTLGTPHVVWCTYPLYTVFYSYFDGRQWTTPIPVNDTTQVTASPQARPRIVMDRTGTMHACFTGAKVGAMHRDIFYCRSDGSGWTSCQMVTRDSLYDEWFSDIAADRPDNVWVVWDRQNEGPDQFRVYASHYNGSEWSSEERLDNDTAHSDGSPEVALDARGLPWAVWDGIAYATGNVEVYCNRYGSTPVNETAPRKLGSTAPALAIQSPAKNPPAISCWLPVEGSATIDLYDAVGRRVAAKSLGIQAPGWHSVTLAQWLKPGIYLCRLTALGQSTVRKLVILGH